MSKYSVLAKCAKEPLFLVTKIGPDYINILQLRKITGLIKTQNILKENINLKRVFFYKRVGMFFKENQPTDVCVFDEIQKWRLQYDCRQEF